MERGNCAYKRNTVSLGKLFNLPVQLNFESHLRLLYLHPCCTRVLYIGVGTHADRRINFFETIADIADQRRRISNKAIRKERRARARVLSPNVERNGKYSTGKPTNNNVRFTNTVSRFLRRGNIHLKSLIFTLHRSALIFSFIFTSSQTYLLRIIPFFFFFFNDIHTIFRSLPRDFLGLHSEARKGVERSDAHRFKKFNFRVKKYSITYSR